MISNVRKFLKLRIIAFQDLLHQKIGNIKIKLSMYFTNFLIKIEIFTYSRK